MRVKHRSMTRASIAAFVFAAAIGAAWAQGHGHGHGGGHGRGGSYGHHGGYGHYGSGHHGYGSYGHGWGYRGWGYGGYPYGWHRGWYGRPWWGAVPYDGYGLAGDAGFVDLDVTPEAARVIVDGQDVGEADDYDGFPTYLPLSGGTHRIELRRRGYRSLSLSVTMEPGWILRLDEELVRGDSEDILYRESAPPARRGQYERDDRAAPSHVHGREAGAARMGLVQLLIDPSDASVYVDGEYQGTVAELAGGLELPRGAHEVRLERDGYASKELQIVVRDGSTYVSAELSSDD